MCSELVVIRWVGRKDAAQIHSVVGLVVTVSDISRRRWCLRITKTNSSLKPAVGPIRKSMAAMPAAWLRRKVYVLQLWASEIAQRLPARLRSTDTFAEPA
jgi:hypothetical protein